MQYRLLKALFVPQISTFPLSAWQCVPAHELKHFKCNTVASRLCLSDSICVIAVQCVLAHELGHLKCDHGVWLSLANIIASGTVSMLPFVSSAVEESLLRSAPRSLMRLSNMQQACCMERHQSQPLLPDKHSRSVHTLCISGLFGKQVRSWIRRDHQF